MVKHYPVGNIPVYRAFGWKRHVGVDWIVEVGTPVLCMQDGEVIEIAQDSKTYGRYILILHENGYASLYAHLSKTFVLKGAWVKGGVPIGLSGGAKGADGAGASEGWHLHFEVRPPSSIHINWFNIDPIQYLGEE